MNTQPLVKKDCGLHYGAQPGPCSKCGYFDRLRFAPEFKNYRAGLQYGGTPWRAFLGEPVSEAQAGGWK